ncbi:type I-E CRISPR-associated protein Cas6/Cse3/CasE, partial [Hansschlegelia beijingensis]
MSLTMIQLRPDMNRVIRFAERERLMADRAGDDLGYAFHALLTAAFGALAPKPFALQMRIGRPAHLLGYAAASADALRDHAAAFAEPDVVQAICLQDLAGKPMPERWKPGARLGFEIRVRPMIRTDRDGDRTRSKEVDAFVLSPPNSSRGAVYTAWLSERLAANCSLRKALNSSVAATFWSASESFLTRSGGVPPRT